MLFVNYYKLYNRFCQIKISSLTKNAYLYNIKARFKENTHFKKTAQLGQGQKLFVFCGFF